MASSGFDQGHFRLTSSDPLNAYESRNRHLWETTGGREGLPMDLPGSRANGGGTFWSRGWRGCPVCGRHAHEAPLMFPFREVRGGVIREGWSCAHQGVPWDE